MIERSSGVLAHVTMLPGPYGCGTFGREAEQFVDLLSECGFTYWQVLPFSHPESENSPYTAYSAFAFNPLLIDPGMLFEVGMLDAAEEREARCNGSHYTVDFEEVKRLRSAALHRAYARMTPEIGRQVKRFVKEEEYWLPDYARFMDCKKGKGDGARVGYYEFVQWVAHSQWRHLKKYANDRGVKIFGDMPIYLSVDSSDVWAHPEYFLLDGERRPEAVAGVPPDYFSADGQLWGNPLYDYGAMEKDGYEWWMRRIGKSLSDFDAVRIDHFRGFSRFWAVPYGAKTAREGKWMKGPGMKLFRRVKERFPDGNIIGEDLGVLDEAAYRFFRQAGYPGMRVLQFAFGKGGDMHRPHNYAGKTVAYTGTHDNDTFLGRFFEIGEEEKDFMCRYLGVDKNICYAGGPYAPLCRAAARALWQSQAVLTVLPYQDLMGWGNDTRMNRPGIPTGCWNVRITPESERELDRAFWARLNRDFDRDGKKAGNGKKE